MLSPSFTVEGDELTVYDGEGIRIGESYTLSPLQQPEQVAAWLWHMHKQVSETD
jgi:hypothetical protein